MKTIIRFVEFMAGQGFPCLFHLMTGLYCPGCGGTRAVRALLRGDLAMSFQYHPLVLYMAAVILAEAVSFGIARATKNPRWFLGHVLGFVYIGVGIILANWIFKNYMLSCARASACRLTASAIRRLSTRCRAMRCTRP